MVIGVHGQMGAGKDITGKIIQYLTQKNGWTKISLDEILTYPPVLLQPASTNWEIKKYAWKLKQCVSLITGIPLSDLEDDEVKDSYLDLPWNKPSDELNPGMDPRMTVRELLQQFGTEGSRSIHPNFWVNALFADYQAINSPQWIITDVRFMNELQAIEARGGFVIKVFRDAPKIVNNGRYNKKTHSSETELNDHRFKYNINNNFDIKTLVKNVKEILIENNII
jgi:hypothetical protein